MTSSVEIHYKHLHIAYQDGKLKLMSQKSGFTLIELLVTITIIAILSAIAMVAYSSVLKQGRDSKRQSDLRSIQSALEQYYSDQGFYPTGGYLIGLDALFNTQTPFTSSTGNPSPPSPAKAYMNSVPLDPVNTGYGRYFYWAGDSNGNECNNLTTGIKCTTYCLYAWLESSNLPANSKPPQGYCTNNNPYTFFVAPP